MTETRVTRSKAKLLNLEDHNANNNSMANKNKQDDSGKIEVDSQKNKMDSAPFKLKNTFNDFNNVRNISETTNYTVSVRETNRENENSEGKKSEQVLESVNKMVISGKTDMKVIRSFMEHVSGGDVVGLMAKLVTSTELDKIVDIVGATEVKQETFNDNIEVSDYQNNVETVAEAISDDETNHTGGSNNIELNKSGNDLPVISEVVGSHFEYPNDDDVEITRVIGDGENCTNSSSSQPSTSVPAPINASNTSSSHSTSGPHEVADFSDYQQLIQRYLAPVSHGSAMDTAQMEAEMLQFFQENGNNGANQLNDVAQLESHLVQFLQQSGYSGYQEFLARSDLSTLAALLPSTSSSSMTTRSSSRRDVPNLPRATLTPMGVSLTPVSSTSPTQPPPAHRRLEPALITPTGVSLTKVATNSVAKGTSQDVSARQLYADPRSDLPPAARNDSVATRPPVIVSVESMTRSASVVANSLAKSSARRASVESVPRSSNVVAQSLAKSSARRTKTAGAVLSKISQKELKQSKDGGESSTRGEAATESIEDDFIGEELDTERIDGKEKTRDKRSKHKRLNNVIEDSESESSVQSASEDSEDEDYVYEEAENENRQRKKNPRAGSSKKRKIVERDESSDSDEHGRKFLRPRFKSTSEEEESYSSDNMTEKAKRSRAFKQFKLKRNSAQKSTEKGKARISARAVDSETDDGDAEKEENSKNRAKRTLYNSPKKKKAKVKVANYIDSSESESDRDLDGFVVDNIESESEDDSDSDEDDDDFVVNDDDDEVLDVNNEFRKMMESLKRRSEKFQNLNEDYEIGSKCKQLGGYDDSDDEPSENNYPPKLLEDLREVRNEASKDKENDGLEDAEDLSNDDVIKEWEMYEVDQSENLDGECVCGQTGLRWMYFMRNKNIENWEFYTRIVGSECINWFHRANPKSCMALLSRVAKDGCILYYRKKLDTGQLLMTVGGNMLPGFLAENQEEHKEEYRLPISVTALKCGTNRVDIKIKPPPASQGKGLEKVRDTADKILVVDQRYHVYLKPSIKPSKPPKCKKHWRGPSKCKCNLKKDPAKVDFIILKIENLKDKEEKASRKTTTVKSFIK